MSETNRTHASGKAKMLERAAAELKSVIVLPLVVFTVREWRSKREAVENTIFAQSWSRAPMVVRSSALIEDNRHASAAGKFSTVLNVSGKISFNTAVEKVRESYGSEANDLDEILVQPMLVGSLCSGAATSLDISGGGRYRVVSWSMGASTNTITSGQDGEFHTWWGLPGEASNSNVGLIEKVQRCIAEIETKMNLEVFEIEFGVNKNENLVLFQLRELASQVEKAVAFEEKLEEVRITALNIASRSARILGNGVLLGAMSDWNPAELIGIRPRPLARSLYEYLVTDEAWSERRAKYGYRDLTNTSLMFDLAGHAFIDVRASLTSLVPAQLPEELAVRLVNAYCALLREEPAQHDKIEFNIAVSCTSFFTSHRLSAYAKLGLSSDDINQIVAALSTMTQRLCSAQLVDEECSHIDQMIALRSSALPPNPLDQAVKLIENSLHFGTVPFGGLARCAFVATEILRSAEAHGILGDGFVDLFFGQLSLPTTTMRDDFASLPFEVFLRRYGHLRPGTYDIRHKRYDEAPEYYFPHSRQASLLAAKRTPEMDTKAVAALTIAFRQIGLHLEGNTFLEFTRKAVEGREWAKFEFSRNISDALKILTEWGKSAGFNREDLADIVWADVRHAAGKSEVDATVFLQSRIERNRQLLESQRPIKLPVLMTSASDCNAFEVESSIPNFVTQLRIVGETALIDNGDDPDGAIVMIEQADPGYDWIFSRKILGLVTAFGGANSHMAVRALEAGIPAAIGCGMNEYKRLAKFRIIELDASTQCVRGVA